MRESYRSMFSVLVSLTLLSLTAVAQQSLNNSSDKEKFWVQNDRGHLIFFAVLEGLYSDGVSNEVVASIIPETDSKGWHDLQENFVYACPLCGPAFEAFRLYAHRRNFQHVKPSNVNTFGTGLDPELERKLLSENDNIRRPALQALIGDWISRYMDRMRLTGEERAEWEKRMDAGREEGMEYLRNKRVTPDKDWENCAICDAAADACALDSKSAPTDK